MKEWHIRLILGAPSTAAQARRRAEPTLRYSPTPRRNLAFQPCRDSQEHGTVTPLASTSHISGRRATERQSRPFSSNHFINVRIETSIPRRRTPLQHFWTVALLTDIWLVAQKDSVSALVRPRA